MGTDALTGVRAETLAGLAGVHLTTARRWKRTRRIAHWLRLLIAVCLEGELAPISRHWAGWRVRGELLVSPEGWQYRRAELYAIPFMRAQIHAYQAQARTHLQADWIDERYVELNAGAAECG